MIDDDVLEQLGLLDDSDFESSAISFDDFEIVDCPEDSFFEHDSYNMLY